MRRKSIKLLALVLVLGALFSLMGVCAFAEDSIIEKVYATSDKSAVVMSTPGAIPFSTSTAGATVTSVTWTDSSGNALAATDTFRQDTYTLVVTLTARDGYVFSQTARGYLYGKSVDIAVSADGKTVSLRQSVQAVIWSPVIVKSPTADPPVNPGGRVSYVSTANYSDSYTWYFVSPDGSETLDMGQAKDRFKGVVFTDTGVSLIIDNVTAEMNNWKVFCRFYESTHTYFTDSEKATIAVNVPETTPAPTPEPTPEPTAEPVPEETAAPETPEESAEPAAAPEESAAPETPDATPAPVPAVWKHNESGHWHDDGNGGVTDSGEHSFAWTSLGGGQEQGVCSVCGYTATRTVQTDAKQDVKGKILIGLGVATAVLMMLSLATPKKKKRR